MKKIFLLFVAISLCPAGFSQHIAKTHLRDIKTKNTINTLHSVLAARTTGVGSTDTLTNIAATDTLTVYTLGSGIDSGYVTGTNIFGDMGFAERYTFNGNDSSMSVIGVMAQFRGKVNPLSTKSVNFKVWNIGNEVPVTATLAYAGFPDRCLDTVTEPFTNLGIGPVTDTLKSFLFPHATVTLDGAFFVGYDMSYNFNSLSGDTIGLASSKDGDRVIPLYNVILHVNDFNDTTRDTLITVQNATLWSDGNWHENYTQNDSLFNDLAIFPIVLISAPTGINSVTKNNLSLFGSYPNPASNSVNINISLAKSATVTVQLMNMEGRVINMITSNALPTGAHTITIPIIELPSGNYIYTIHTSNGENMASQFTVIK